MMQTRTLSVKVTAHLPWLGIALLLFSFSGASAGEPREIDLFILAGQSNAVGLDADPKALPPDSNDSRVLFWWKADDPAADVHDSSSGNEWLTLRPQDKDQTITPQNNNTQQNGNFELARGCFGPEIGFARRLLATRSDNYRGSPAFAILKVCFNGTSVKEDWNPDLRDQEGNCFGAFVEQYEKAKTDARSQGITFRPAALLWVQGESDSKEDRSERYAESLTKTIAAFRESIQNETLPVRLAVNTRFGKDATEVMKAIVEGQKSISASNPNCEYVDTWKASVANQVHFDAEGTLQVGELFADSLNASVAPKLPNIVIFLVDDMGVMDTSLPFLTDENGKPKRYPLNDFYRTPNMERLAKRGVRFNHFCAMSVCSPTRISIMTGQNAARHRTTNWINPGANNRGTQGPPQWNWSGLKRGEVTLARVLRQSGYRTIHVGKAHFGPQSSEGTEPLNLGFDINVGGSSIGQPGSYYAENNFDRANKKGKKGNVDQAVHGLEKYHGSDVFLTEALTREAKSHVSDAVNAKKPFFLNFAHYAVHSPFESDRRFADHYKDSGKPAPAQAFATLIEGMDRSLGDLLDHLEKIGVAENTLVLFLGDNGSDAPLGHEHAVACAAPLRGKKGSHYEGGTRVPFIAAWASPRADHPNQRLLPIATNVIQSQQAAVQDVFPTIMGLTGAETPKTHVVDGKRLDTLLTGKPDSDRSETFLMHYPHGPHRTSYWTSFRNGDWKVIYHYLPTEVSGGSHYQLFNLRSDPFEQKDLSAANGAELKRMMQELVDALDSHEAVYPVEKGETTPMRPVMPR